MREGKLGWIVSVVWIALLAANCSKIIEPDGTGGETNWLHCEKQSDCAQGYLCQEKKCMPEGGGHDAGSRGGPCDTAADCALIPLGCCSACDPTTSDFVAVAASEREAEQTKRCPKPGAS